MDDLKRMVNGHLTGKTAMLSEFSSWTASISMVLYLGHEKHTLQNHKEAHICVIDTRRLQNVSIYHVNSLAKAKIAAKNYSWEYLAHGKIEGPSFSAIPLARLLELGLHSSIPAINEYGWWTWYIGSNWEKRPVTPITEDEVRCIKRIASEFGNSFTLGITAALITITPRKTDPDGKLTEEDIKNFRAGLDDLEIPYEYGTQDSIIVNGVYIHGYPQISQMLKLLQGLVESSWGRGRREPKKSAKALEAEGQLAGQMDELSLKKSK